MFSKRALSLIVPSGARRVHSIPASFYRGGTSKAVIFQAKDLPDDLEDRAKIFRAAIGSPDPNGRQLNGMGGGLSSVSKVLVLDKSARDDVDVEYTFVQVGVKDGLIDYGSNCGNMLAAVGPFALENSIAHEVNTSEGNARVRIYNTNTKKIIDSTFPLDRENRPQLEGDFAIDGVAGTSSRIQLDFVQPGGSRTGKLLPTGNAVDDLSSVPEYDGPAVKVSLVDCGNPCSFLDATSLPGFDPTILPSDLEKDRAMIDGLEKIRRASLVLMGLASSMSEAAKVRSIPKVCIVSPSTDHQLLSGDRLSGKDIDFVVRCMSSGDPHRALPITAALCCAAAAQTEGTVLNQMLGGSSGSQVVIGHPSGTIAVSADVQRSSAGEWTATKAGVLRTARKLFEGRVFV